MTVDKENSSPNVVKRKATQDGAFPKTYTPNDTLSKKQKPSQTPAQLQQLSPIQPSKRPLDSISSASSGRKEVLSYFKETNFTPLKKKIMHRVGEYECEANERFIERARTPMRGSAMKAVTAMVDTSLSFSLLDRSQSLDVDLSLSFLKEDAKSAPEIIVGKQRTDECAAIASEAQKQQPLEQQPPFDVEMHFREDCEDMGECAVGASTAKLERFSLWASAYAAFALTMVSVLFVAVLAATATLRRAAAVPAPVMVTPKIVLGDISNSTATYTIPLHYAPYVPSASRRRKQPKCNVSAAPIASSSYMYKPSGSSDFFVPISLHQKGPFQAMSFPAYSLPSPVREITPNPSPSPNPSLTRAWTEESQLLDLMRAQLQAAESAKPTDMLAVIVSAIAVWRVVRGAASLCF